MKPKILQEAIDNGAFFVSENDERRYYEWIRSRDKTTALIVIIALTTALLLLGIAIGQSVIIDAWMVL